MGLESPVLSKKLLRDELTSGDPETKKLLSTIVREALREELKADISLEIKPKTRGYTINGGMITDLISFKGDLYGIHTPTARVVRLTGKGVEVVYAFEDFGDLDPDEYRSGGDRWGASAIWNGELYFGGAVFAPPLPSYYGDMTFFNAQYVFIIKSPDGNSWSVVYSQLGPVGGGYHGRITDMCIYDETEMHVARGDSNEDNGPVQNGIWILEPDGTFTLHQAGAYLKFGRWLDWICAGDEDSDVVYGARRGIGGITTATYNLVNQKGPDGVNDVQTTGIHSMFWWRNSFLLFDSRGVFIGDPLNFWELGLTPRTAFVPLFLDGYGRTVGYKFKSAYVNGKIITALNTDSTALLGGPSVPSYLLEIGNTIRIIGTAGSYGSVCLHGGKLYVVSSHFMRDGHAGRTSSSIVNVTPIDLGLLQSSKIQPPIVDWVWNGAYVAGAAGSGWKGFIGGWPTAGYKNIMAHINSSVATTMTVYFADLIQSNAPNFQVETLGTEAIAIGANSIDLSSYGLFGILLFSFADDATIRFYLGMST